MRLRYAMILGAAVAWCGGAAQAQQAGGPGSETVIKTETRVVLVDAVVTDKKGNYVHDLEAKDFRVWEDGKEQSVTSFSYEADPKSPTNSQKHYLVLFFDNSTMDFGAQARARQAAAKFIDANGGSNRYMAIANFGGSVRIAQNFTNDAERLKKVVSNTGFSNVSPNAPVELASLGIPSLGGTESEFGVNSVLLALRSLAKNLSSVPGRKILVLFTEGFALSVESMSELTDTISTCNRANVAIYPIDARGLTADLGGTPGGEALRLPAESEPVRVWPVSLGFGNSFLQHGGGGGGGHGGGGTGGGGGGGGTGGGRGGGGTGGGTGGGKGGGGTGGGTGGGKGGGTGVGKGGGTGVGRGGGSGVNPLNSLTRNPYNQSRTILPPFPESSLKNQEMMYALATGTGGFVIVNTNDLFGGLQKIANEQDQFYLLGYTPPESAEGSCHTLKVKVDRGANVRARSGYCLVKPVDLLAGNATEKDLESRLAGGASGITGAMMAAPYFYTSPNVARVNVALEVPAGAVKFEKVKGKFHAVLNVLGIAYRPDGGVAARFSDTVKLDVENKKEMQELKDKPMHYEDQFDIGSGQYTLKVGFNSGGQDFGKVEVPLAIDPYDGKHFTLSAVALSNQFHKVENLGESLDAVLLEGHTPLVSRGVQVIPSGANRFKKTDSAGLYIEIYEPLLTAQNPPVVGIQLRVFDRKANEPKVDSGMMGVTPMVQTGNPLIPIALKLPVADLAPGAYRAELKATDSAGNTSAVRAADFEVE